ncbi:MAG TPA: rhodanese-like domain-containing protein [Candidatus Binatia bacterium]|nr:rhodanese-like domain-containing protein [Candidatus Binatia bacterium]
MLREPQHERNVLNHFKILSVRHFDKLSAGSELVKRLRVRPAFFLLSWLTLVPVSVHAGHGVEDAIDTIAADRVKRLLVSGAKLTLVDLRPAKEFQENRLPGARSIPMTELPKRFEEIPKAGQVVLYCACTINEIAERVAFLEFRGYRNIFVLMEGFPGWVKRGYPLETGRR